jgi:hypothetical protein
MVVKPKASARRIRFRSGRRSGVMRMCYVKHGARPTTSLALALDHRAGIRAINMRSCACDLSRSTMARAGVLPASENCAAAAPGMHLEI